jgi:hypothetical protein
MSAKELLKTQLVFALPSGNSLVRCAFGVHAKVEDEDGLLL